MDIFSDTEKLKSNGSISKNERTKELGNERTEEKIDGSINVPINGAKKPEIKDNPQNIAPMFEPKANIKEHNEASVTNKEVKNASREFIKDINKELAPKIKITSEILKETREAANQFIKSLEQNELKETPPEIIAKIEKELNDNISENSLKRIGIAISFDITKSVANCPAILIMSKFQGEILDKLHGDKINEIKKTTFGKTYEEKGENFIKNI